MKKIFLFASALAGMFLAGSCQRENLEPMESANTVTYTVTVPDALATKGIGDDVSNVNTLHYEVYRTVAPNDVEFTAEDRLLYHKTATAQADGTFKIDLELVNDQNFTVLFWAQVEKDGFTSPYVVTDLTNVKLNSSINANQVDYAAFSGVDFIEGKDALTDKTVELTRPVAQINLGTTVASLEAFDTDIAVSASSMTVAGLSNTFDVAKQAASGELISTTVYAEQNVPTKDKLTVNTTDYVYVGMNYAGFAPEVGTPVTVSYDLITSEGLIQNSIENVPVKPNFRTNIVGNLITSKTAYTIELDETWGGADLAPDPIYLVAAIGGELTLQDDVVLAKPLNIHADMVLNLNGKTISAAMENGNGAVVNIAEGVTAQLIGGTIKNTTENGDAAVNNAGNLVLSGVEIKGAPIADVSYPAYAVISSGYMVIEEGTVINADRGSIKVTGAGETVINGGTFTNNDIGSRNLTSHVVDVQSGSTHKLTINGGTFQHLHAATSGGVVICNRTSGTVYVNGGNFSGGNYYGNNNLSDYGYGGTFSVKGGVYDANPAAKYIATGYKAVSINGKFHVLPEVVADAATAANVTAVTESTADVATALATDNGEATMFMWNDVAYIAKYGEVVITSSADDATTVRGVVEGAAGLTSATVAEGIEAVGERTFRKCANLETVVFPSTLTEIGPAVFQSCSKLANVTIPASVTTIGEGAFKECWALTSINIPDGITRIEKDTFNNTGIESIEFHEGVTYFGAQAFRDCENLTEVKILAKEFTIEPNTFINVAGSRPSTTIYVENEQMKSYLEGVFEGVNDAKHITVVCPTTVQTTVENPAAVTYSGGIFQNPINDALYFKNYIFKGDASIKIENKKYGAIILEDCKGEINNDLIAISNQSYQDVPVIILENLDFKLAEGKKLINSDIKIHQVFLVNITINGVKQTQDSIADFLGNVEWYQVVDEDIWNNN